MAAPCFRYDSKEAARLAIERTQAFLSEHPSPELKVVLLEEEVQ